MNSNGLSKNDLKYLELNPGWHTSDSYYKAKVVKKMIKDAELNPTSIFDLGCGYGEVLKYLFHNYDSNIYYKGFDVSHIAIKNAKKFESKNLQFINDSFENYNDRCDLLLMLDVFEHVEDYLTFIRSNISKSNYCILHIPLDLSVESIIRKSYLFTRSKFGHLHYFTRDLIFEILKDLNLQILKIIYTSELDLPNYSLGSKILYPFRKLFEFLFGRRTSSFFLGGYSIMVLVKEN